MASTSGPRFIQYFGHVLDAIRASGGVARPDRGLDYCSNFSPFRVSVTGFWMLSDDDFDPVAELSASMRLEPLI